MEDSNCTIISFGVGPYYQNAIFERRIQTLPLGDIILLLYAKNIFARVNKYNVMVLCTEGICIKLNELKMGGCGINPMENFSGTTTYINIKNHHTWGCPVCVLDSRLQGKISGLLKC